MLSNGWFANKEKVNEVLSGKPGKTGWTINFDELSKITRGHPDFLDKVMKFAEKDLKFVYNAAVYRWSSKAHIDGEENENIAIVFDLVDNHIQLFSCRVDHEHFPFVVETSLNKSFVWMMAKML